MAFDDVVPQDQPVPAVVESKPVKQIPYELDRALSYKGMNLELFHAYGAPAVPELQLFLDGSEPTQEQERMMSEALLRMKATGRKEF